METLTLEQKVLLELLAGEITGTVRLDETELKTVNWDSVRKEAKAQAVPLMAAEGAAKYKEYITDFTPWKGLAAGALTANIRTACHQQALGELMHGRPYFILKGLAAASYYPKPQERSLGDIDFLIDPAQRAEVEQLLEENGYENWNTAHICHVVFPKGSAHLEMHFEISGIPYGKPGEIIRDFMKDAMAHRKTAAFDEWKFPAPDDLHHGLIILLHMQHHMLGEGLGLRHLCDWACYVQKTADEPFWPQLLDLFRAIGLLTYAEIITKICALYFHIACPAWAEGADEPLCHDLMQDILVGGNFGTKDKARARSGMMISEHGKSGTSRGTASNLFWTLHHSTPAVYPVVKKCPPLYPFLDGWRILLYLCRTATGKRISITKLAPMAKQRKSIYDRLHVFETDDRNNG